MVVRSKHGDWLLWKVITVYDESSPYMHGILVSNHKFHKAGKSQLLCKVDYIEEPDPEGFAKNHGFTITWTKN